MVILQYFCRGKAGGVSIDWQIGRPTFGLEYQLLEFALDTPADRQMSDRNTV